MQSTSSTAVIVTQPAPQSTFPTAYKYQSAAIQPENPAVIQKIYSAEIDNAFKWAQCLRLPLGLDLLFAPCSCAVCKFESLIKPRRYIEVHENRIELNDPGLDSCCGCCCFEATDNVRVFYFDRVHKVKRCTCCSPYHFCWCIECCGEVIAIEHKDRYTCSCCACCRPTCFGGVFGASEFVTQFKEARARFQWRKTAVPFNPSFQIAVTTTTTTTNTAPNFSDA